MSHNSHGWGQEGNVPTGGGTWMHGGVGVATAQSQAEIRLVALRAPYPKPDTKRVAHSCLLADSLEERAVEDKTRASRESGQPGPGCWDKCHCTIWGSGKGMVRGIASEKLDGVIVSAQVADCTCLMRTGPPPRGVEGDQRQRGQLAEGWPSG